MQRFAYNSIHQNRDTFSSRKRLSTLQQTFKRRSELQAPFDLKKPYLAMKIFSNTENLTQFYSFLPRDRYQLVQSATITTSLKCIRGFVPKVKFPTFPGRIDSS